MYTIVDLFNRANSALGGVGNNWTDTNSKFQVASSKVKSDGSDFGYRLLRPVGEAFKNGKVRYAFNRADSPSDGAIIACLRVQANGNAVGAFIFAGVGGSLNFQLWKGVGTTYTFPWNDKDATVTNLPDSGYLVVEVNEDTLTATIYQSDGTTVVGSPLSTTGVNAICPNAGTYGLCAFGGAVDGIEVDAGSGGGPSVLSIGSISAASTATAVTLSLSALLAGGTGTGYAYKVWRDTQPVVSTAGAPFATPTAFPWVDAATAPGTDYYYKLIGYDDGTGVANALPAGLTGAPTDAPLGICIRLRGRTLLVVAIGDSITYGANAQPGIGPTGALKARLETSAGIRSVYLINKGSIGSTLAANQNSGWQKGGNLYTGAASTSAGDNSAAYQLTQAHPDGELLYSVMLATNDTAASRTKAQYKADAVQLVTDLLNDWPTAKIVLHAAPWFSPNAQTGNSYNEAGLSLLRQYAQAIDEVVTLFAASKPGQVLSGDKRAYPFFAQNYQALLTPENGSRGTFYLHPNADGNTALGELHAEAIYDAILVPRTGAGSDSPSSDVLAALSALQTDITHILDKVGPLPDGAISLLTGVLARVSPGVHLRSLDGSPIGVQYLKAGDSAPELRAQVVDSAGYPINLTGCRATFHMVPRRPGSDNEHTVSGDAVIESAAAGCLCYTWTEADTVAGSYLASITLTDADGHELTLPSSGGIAVEINP